MTAPTSGEAKADTPDLTRTLRTTVEDALADLLEPLGRLDCIRGDLAALGTDLRRWAEQTTQLAQRLDGPGAHDLKTLTERLDDVGSIAQRVCALLEAVPTLPQLRETVAAAIEPLARAVSGVAEAVRSVRTEEMRDARARHEDVVARLGALAETEAAHHGQAAEAHEAARKELAGRADLLHRDVMRAVADRPRHAYLELRATAQVLEGIELTPVSGKLTVSTDPSQFFTAAVQLTAGVTVAQTGDGGFEVLVGEWRVRRVEDRWCPARLSAVADRAVAAARPIFAAPARPLLRRLPRRNG